MSNSTSLTTKMLIALVLGVIVGFILQFTPPGFVRDTIIIHGVLMFFGELFLNLIWMIVIPLIFFSLIVGVTAVADPQKVGRIGGKLTLIYILSTVPAIGAAMFFGFVLNPARNVTYEMAEAFGVTPTIAAAPPLVNVLLNIVPRNPFAALASTATLQIIFVAILIGLAILAIGEAGAPAKKLCISFNGIIMKITEWVMKVAPIGVFALIARSFSTLGMSAIMALFGFVLVVWIALAFHTIVVYGLALKIFVGKDPHTGKLVSLTTMLKKVAPALAFAFSSASSAATLPVTMRCARNVGFNREMTSVAFPLGVTLNMDGTAIFQGVAIVFLASLYGIALDIGSVVTILITATLATLGTAGVPGAGMIMLSVVLASVGMPIEAIALIFGIDRIVDMPRTAINVCGDFIYSMIVAKPEGMIDWQQFNSDVDVSMEEAV